MLRQAFKLARKAILGIIQGQAHLYKVVRKISKEFENTYLWASFSCSFRI